MKQTYITDLDHTFLRSDLSISGYTQEIWNSMAKSSTLSIATARSYKKSEQFLRQLHLHAPLILLDGALIVSEEKKIIDMKVLGREISDAVVSEGAGFGIYPVILSLVDRELNEAFLYPKIRNTFQDRLMARYGGDDNLIEQKYPKAMDENFKIVYMGEESLLRPLTEHLKSVFGDTLEYKLAPEAYLGCYYLSILHPLADKAHGLQKLIDHLELDAKGITVFGDSLNDLGMFAKAGTSVAVGNALDEVKEKADIVLPHTNDEDAVAKYLSGKHNAAIR